MKTIYCTECGEKITEEQEKRGDTRILGEMTYHKLCFKELINREHKKQRKLKWSGLFKKPRFIVAWWTPYIWILIGIYFFIGNIVSLNFFKNVAIYNLTELMYFGSTNPPIVAYLAGSTGVCMFMIVYGLYLFNHTEEID